MRAGIQWRGARDGLRSWSSDVIVRAGSDGHAGMSNNPILDLPLNQVMRSEIALTLQHILKLHTVGSLLTAWGNPRNHTSIEQVFESPEQAHHAVATCAAWLGLPTPALHDPVAAWWTPGEERAVIGATS